VKVAPFFFFGGAENYSYLCGVIFGFALCGEVNKLKKGRVAREGNPACV
jgi:hypothetical protein